MGKASVGVKQKTGHINTEIETSLSGIRTAKAFANEKVENARFRAANEIYKTSKREFHKAMGRFASSMEFSGSHWASMPPLPTSSGWWQSLPPVIRRP